MNRNMKRITKIIVFSISLLLLTALAVSADDARVSRLNLSPLSGETVLKIDVSGPFQFVHETAEAKNGKPFRVVVDIFPAVHDLWQKDFVDLPKTLLSSIRTSQYAVNPENVVRIVCDLDQTVMYRVEKKGNSVYLYLPDKKNSNFTAWSSPLKTATSVKTPLTVAKVSSETKNEPAKKVVKKKVVKKVEKTPPPAKTVKEEKITVAKQYQTKSSDYIDHDKYLSTQKSLPEGKQIAAKQVASAPTTNSEPVMKAKVEKTKVEKQETVAAKKKVADKPAAESKSQVTTASLPAKETTTKKEVVKFDPPEVEPKSGTPVQEFTMVKKTAPDKKESKKETVNAAPVVKKSTTETKEVAETDIKEVDKAKDNQKPTSRFRRKPAFPTKLKGTIVAEFPTRIVMKYSPGTGRDPFKNLLTDTKGTADPIQKKIPDVETAKLVGVLESTDGQKRALLEDHDGYGYILKSGDKIKKGYVGKIYSDKAYFKLFEYGWSRTVALYMSIN